MVRLDAGPGWCEDKKMGVQSKDGCKDQKMGVEIRSWVNELVFLTFSCLYINGAWVTVT